MDEIKCVRKLIVDENRLSKIVLDMITNEIM